MASSALPIVSGVGHETDFTIADFAADVRAPTPTGAAELVSPQRVLLLRDLDQRHAALARAFGRMMERRTQQLDWLERRLVSPAERLTRQHAHLRQLTLRLAAAGCRPVRDARARFAMVRLRWQRCRPDAVRAASDLQRLSQRLRQAAQQQHERRRARVSELAARTALLSPQRTLERGYAALLDAQGRAVRKPTALQPGKRVTVHLAEGSAELGIADVQPRLDAVL
jgi:exodeoxyribonuclease VII large subunit